MQRTALLNQCRLRVCDLDYLRLTGSITRDRCSQIVLGFDHAFAREINPRCGARCLCTGGVKLLRETAQRQCSFVLCCVNAKTRLTLPAAARAPVEDWNRQTDCR